MAKEELNFEESLKKLEEIVKELENTFSNISLFVNLTILISFFLKFLYKKRAYKM